MEENLKSRKSEVIRLVDKTGDSGQTMIPPEGAKRLLFDRNLLWYRPLPEVFREKFGGGHVDQIVMVSMEWSNDFNGKEKTRITVPLVVPKGSWNNGHGLNICVEHFAPEDAPAIAS